MKRVGKITPEVIRARIQKLVELACAGSQQQFAEKIGVSPATLSLVLSGSRAASPKLLTAIKAVPSLDYDWLTTGIGEPLNIRPRVLTDHGAVIPVARQPLPAAAVDCQHLLSMQFMAVPRAHFHDEAYALILQDTDMFWSPHDMKKQNLQKNDILIINASPELCNTVDPITGPGGRVLKSGRCSQLQFGVFLPTSQHHVRHSGSQIPNVMDDEKPHKNDALQKRLNAIIIDPESCSSGITNDNEASPNKPANDVMSASQKPTASVTAEQPRVTGVVTLLMRQFNTP